MSAFVVAANFLNRSSQYPWYVRRKELSVSVGVTCLAAVARGATFGPAAAEAVHGCVAVGLSEEAFAYGIQGLHIPNENLFDAAALGFGESELSDLRFDALTEKFHLREEGTEVRGAEILVLTSDRRILAYKPILGGE